VVPRFSHMGYAAVALLAATGAINTLLLVGNVDSDAAKREIVKRITFAVPGVPAEAIQPVGIAITRDRKLAFVALGPANRVAVIDAQS